MADGELETIEVNWPEKFSGPVIINKADFDEKVHTIVPKKEPKEGKEGEAPKGEKSEAKK